MKIREGRVGEGREVFYIYNNYCLITDGRGVEWWQLEVDKYNQRGKTFKKYLSRNSL